MFPDVRPSLNLQTHDLEPSEYCENLIFPTIFKMVPVKDGGRFLMCTWSLFYTLASKQFVEVRF